MVRFQIPTVFIDFIWCAQLKLSFFFQPDRESTPVPFNEVDQEEERETFDNGSSNSAKEQNTFKSPPKSAASHLMAQETGTSNDDSFLSAFASMKVGEKVGII